MKKGFRRFAPIQTKASLGLGNVDNTSDLNKPLSSADLIQLSKTPRWVLVNKTYLDFAIAGLTNDIEIYSLPPQGVIDAVVIKHSAPFAGGGTGAYTISVGITGTLAKYNNAFNVFQAPGATVFDTSSGTLTPPVTENFSINTSIRAAAIADVNLNLATGGSVDIWMLISTLP